jgi:aryl-alcohol dehydrogenase-like predicted oxidoreductase
VVNYRPLGKTEIEVSEVGFGTWTLTSGKWGPFPPEKAVELLRYAYAQGIVYFDTSGAQAGGLGEVLLAKAFGDTRDHVVITTKVGYTADGGRRDFSPDHLRRAVDGSLARLGSSYIDVLQLHHPDMAAVTNEGLWQALEDMKSEGKIRYYGLVFGPGPTGLEEGRVAMRKRDIGCIQVYYNILEQEPSRKFFPVALEINQGMVIRGPHAGGVLEADPAEATRFPEDEDLRVKHPEFIARGVKQADSLRWIHEGRGMSLPQAALKFILSEETVSSVIPNIYRADQVDAYGAVSDFDSYSQVDLGEIAEQFRKGFGVA